MKLSPVIEGPYREETSCIVAVFLLLVNLSLQYPKLENCPLDFVVPDSMANHCGLFTCSGNKISGVGCAGYFCSPGKELGYKQSDDSKTYPECCGGPICAD